MAGFLEVDKNHPTLLRCTFVIYLLHTLFLVLYMQTKQFLNPPPFVVLGTNTLDSDVHIYGFRLNIVGLQGLPEVLMCKKTAKTEV